MKRPTGFTWIALYCAWPAVHVLAAALPQRMDYSDRYDDLSGLPILIAMFAAVAAEALWRCQPWAFRAFLAYVCVADLVWFGSVGNPASGMVTEELVSRLLVGVASLAYVYNRSRVLFGAPAVPSIMIGAPRP